MFKKKLLYNFFIIFISTNLLSSEQEEYLAWDCNGKNENCYPFWYDSYFTNYVAILNVFGPVISICALKTFDIFRKKFDAKINKNIKNKLIHFENFGEELRNMLASIIKSFDNGIGENCDHLLARSTIEFLNQNKCRNCIDEFVSIVSKSFDNEQHEQKNNNREKFNNFVKKFENGNHCDCAQIEKLENAHSTIQISTGSILEKNCTKPMHACLEKWTHPFHVSSLAYAVLSMSASFGFATLVEPPNTAGSYIGDAANVINALTIPTTAIFFILQNRLNLEREEKKLLHPEIARRIEEVSGIIEIAGFIIGTMDNKISPQEAKGFIKALLLAGWPKNLEAEFINLASGKIDKKHLFIKNLYYQLNQKNLPYFDEDINAALENFDSAEIKINESSLLSNPDVCIYGTVL